jgi:hypothetical protein
VTDSSVDSQSQVSVEVVDSGVLPVSLEIPHIRSLFSPSVRAGENKLGRGRYTAAHGRKRQPSVSADCTRAHITCHGSKKTPPRPRATNRLMVGLMAGNLLASADIFVYNTSIHLWRNNARRAIVAHGQHRVAATTSCGIRQHAVSLVSVRAGPSFPPPSRRK